MRPTTILLLAMAVGAAPALAQHEEHGHEPMSDEAQELTQCTAMLGAAPPQALLRNSEYLELTAEQVSRLETLQERAVAEARPHMQPVMEAHAQAAEHLRGDAPDFEGYEGALREAADHMVQAHVAMARVAVEARQVLTPQQLARLGDPPHGGMHGGDPMPGGGSPDEHGMMGAGMHGMMGCMMMGHTEDGGPGLFR